MKLSTNKTTNTVITMILMFAITFSLFTIAPASAQAGPALVMNIGGDNVLVGTNSDFDIDLNGGPGGGELIELWAQYPGRTLFTFIGTYTTSGSGDLDVYDFYFNETGVFNFKWRYPLAPNAESNVDTVTSWVTLPFSPIRQLLKDRWNDQIPTWVWVVPSPNPVGVGQQVSFIMMNPQVPYLADANNDIRYEYSLKITAPNGVIENLPGGSQTSDNYQGGIKDGHFLSDSTGTAYTLWTPTQVGNYSVEITFHELYYRWNYSEAALNYYGVTLLESQDTEILVVQDEPVVSVDFTTVPLPTEYWARPIEGQNTMWYQVASNWYNNARDRDNGGPRNAYQPDGEAPNSAHILWTKPTEDGGVVGGNHFSVQGEVYNAGHQYQTRMDGNTILMNGKMYYRGPQFWSGEGDTYRAVDLRTGETLWESDLGGDSPSFGYMYDWDDMNQHGVVNPGWLFSNNFGDAIHPLYGTKETLTLTGVPSGGTWQLAGPKGEVLRVVIDSDGWMGQWNSSRAFISQSSGTINAATENRYDYNVSVPWRVGMTGGSVTIRGAIYNDVLIGSNGSHAVGTNAVNYHVAGEFTLWAVSLKPGDEGRLIWMKNFQTAGFPDNHVVQFRKAGGSTGEGVFTMIELPYQLTVGYDMNTGNLLWKAETPAADFNPFGYYGYASLINQFYDKIAYDKVFVSGYSGMVFAYDLRNGTLLWRYTAPTGLTVFKYYSLFMGILADEKLYIGTHEHSADTPLFKGNKVRALDVNTGEEVFTVYGWAYPGTMAIADGTLVYWNNYDHQIYALAKGPSSMTVEAPLNAATMGSSLVIRGTITDVSAGTMQHEQAMRFPNGVPAVSDASQSRWMEYVYMQKVRPTDTIGVEIALSVVDSNGNFREIGTTTSEDGTFSFTWMPDIEGDYTVYAAFAGSNSYWPSHAVTSFVVDAAAATPAPTAAPAESVADMYFVPAIAGLFVAIIVVGLLIMLVLRKRP